MKIAFIQMGGTIDKDYPRSVGGWAFEIGDPAVDAMMKNYRHNLEVEIISLRKKDSQEITEEDRRTLVETISGLDHDRVIITHGTDTMIETGKFIHQRVDHKSIILTGAFLPARFKDSDASLNLGMAIAAVPVVAPGTYIALNGNIIPVHTSARDSETGLFINLEN